MLRDCRLSGCLVLGVLLVTALAEEEEEVPSRESVAIAATLLGAISFLMSLYYLTNHHDPDMRRYTYEVISATISIFCAVLLFQSGNDLLEAWLFPGLSEWERLGISFCILLFWHFVLQLTLAVTSGAIDELIGSRQMDMEQIEANMKCYAVLLAHMTGFASINFWAGLQQVSFFRSSPHMVLLTICISVPAQLFLAQITKAVRRAVALADDGEVDEKEAMWESETAESENDVMGLSVSFQAIQALRFLIGGTLPNVEGEEAWDTLTGHTGFQARMLLLVGGIIVLSIFFMLIRLHGTSRAFALTITTLSMCFAWCVFFSFEWYIGSMKMVGGDPMFLSILLATVLSIASFSTIRALDILVDADWTDDRVDEAVKQIISAIGILVGFAWEQCFDHATMALSEVLPMRHVSKLLLAIFCAVILVPAWRSYILPMVVSEGWRFGFVIHPDEGRWKEVIKHERFDSVLRKLGEMQPERSERSLQRSATMGKVQLLNKTRQDPSAEEDPAKEEPAKEIRTTPRTSPRTTPRRSRFRNSRRLSTPVMNDGMLAEKLLYQYKQADEEQRSGGAFSRQVSSNGDALGDEVERLKQRNAWLEAKLKEVSSDYLNHMNVIHDTFGRMGNALGQMDHHRSAAACLMPGSPKTV